MAIEAENKDLLEVKRQLEIEIESSLPSDHPDQQKFEDMYQWMSSGGADVDRTRLRSLDSKRGVFAAANFKNEDIIMEIPSNMLIGINFALTTPIGKAMQ